MRNTPRTDKALRNTQGMFRAASAANGFTDHAVMLELESAAHAARAGELEKALAGLVSLYDVSDEQLSMDDVARKLAEARALLASGAARQKEPTP